MIGRRFLLPRQQTGLGNKDLCATILEQQEGLIALLDGFRVGAQTHLTQIAAHRVDFSLKQISGYMHPLTAAQGLQSHVGDRRGSWHILAGNKRRLTRAGPIGQLRPADAMMDAQQPEFQPVCQSINSTNTRRTAINVGFPSTVLQGKFGNRIDATGVKGMTAQQAAERQPDATHHTVAFNSFAGVLGATRIKPAVVAQPRADQPLVNTDPAQSGRCAQPRQLLPVPLQRSEQDSVVL